MLAACNYEAPSGLGAEGDGDRWLGWEVGGAAVGTASGHLLGFQRLRGNCAKGAVPCSA